MVQIGNYENFLSFQNFTILGVEIVYNESSLVGKPNSNFHYPYSKQTINWGLFVVRLRFTVKKNKKIYNSFPFWD